jgi:hypothetical protein
LAIELELENIQKKRRRRIKYEMGPLTEEQNMAKDAIEVIPSKFFPGNRLGGVDIIFLFAGQAHTEEILVSNLIRDGCDVRHVSLVDISYPNEDVKREIRERFPDVEVEFYGVNELERIKISSYSVCIGFRPQFGGSGQGDGESNKKKIEAFATHYTEENAPIYLFKEGGYVIVHKGEKLQNAVRRLYDRNP